MEQPQQMMPTPTPTPTPEPQKPNNSKGIIGMILALAGFIAFGLPLGIAALILGAIENPRSPYGWTAIVLGILDILVVLIYLNTL